MNKTTTLSPLTTMAPALFTCLKLNAFLARRALHLANAQKSLNKAAAINIGADDIAENGCRDGLPDDFMTMARN